MSALEKVLALSGTQAASAEENPAADLVLALSSALDGLRLYLASSDSDDDGDDDSGKGDSDGDSGHSSHAAYKSMIKKGVKPAMAAKMCARSDKKVAASVLAENACIILAGLTEPGEAPAQEPTYLGRMVALAAPPGERVSERKLLAAVAAADVLALAAVTKPVKGTEAVAHPPFHGVHAHAHVHAGDNMHGGASDRYAVG